MADNGKVRDNGRRIVIGVGILSVLALGCALYWFFFMRGIVFTDDARFDGHMVDLAPQINGKLLNVYLQAGDRVRKDELMFALDRRACQAALERAENEAAAAGTALEMARAENRKTVRGPRREEIAIAEANKREADAALALAEADWTRAGNLFEKHDLPASERDRIRKALESARQVREAAVQRLELLLKGSREEDLSVASLTVELRQSQLAAAQAAADQARLDLEHTEVRAPFDGYVVRRWRDPGATLAAGTPVLTVLDPGSLYVSANVREKDLEHLRPGDRVDISVDAYPGRELTGRVSRIMRAANSEFSLIPSEGVSGTFIKVTQRFPLRVELDSIPELPLGPGLSVALHIHYLQHVTPASPDSGNVP